MTKYYGKYGGQFVSELLIEPLNQLERTFNSLKTNTDFLSTYQDLLKHYVGRPSPLTHAKNLSRYCQGGQIYLKREDLNHTGAHKINNAIGQSLLAKHIKKHTVIAETGAGQHGVATATAAALLGLKAIIFMGARDIERQASNVYKMKLLGAQVIPVHSGSKVLKDATNAAIRYWIDHLDTSYYLIGSAIGPHPYPEMVKFFQSVIGRETKAQTVHLSPIKKIFACVGGGSNAIGIFDAFMKTNTDLIGIEACGKGINSHEHAASLTKGTPGILHGALMYLLQDPFGNVQEAYSLSPGLDYPGVGPEHCYLKDLGRVRYECISDQEALEALKLLTTQEGIIPALESAHALAQCLKEAPLHDKDDILIICLSGRGDKDLASLEQMEVINEEKN